MFWTTVRVIRLPAVTIFGENQLIRDQDLLRSLSGLKLLGRACGVNISRPTPKLTDWPGRILLADTLSTTYIKQTALAAEAWQQKQR
jgi:hypothetical protein